MVPYLCWHWGENAGILGLCMPVLVCMSKKPPEVLSLWQLQFLATRCKTAILLSPPRPLSLGLAKPKLKGLYTSSKNPLPTQTSASLNHCYSCCCLQEKQHVSVHFQLVLTRKTNNCCETIRASLRSNQKKNTKTWISYWSTHRSVCLSSPLLLENGQLLQNKTAQASRFSTYWTSSGWWS